MIVGRDPPRGTIIPRYEPPAGFSPAAVRYVTKTTYDRKAFSAALIDMAVKGFLRIKQTSDTTFILDKEPHANKGALSTGERAIAAELFRKKPQVRLNRKYKASVKRALSSHEEKVRADYDDGYFLRNRGYRMVGLAMAVVGMLIAGLVAAEFAPAFFLAIGVAVCVWVLLTFAFSFVRALAGGPRIGAAVGSLVMVAIALVAGAAAGVFLSDAISTPGALVAALVGATTFFFDEWLKAPTRVGRKILDQIEGLKMYMTVAEKDRLNLINPPDRTPETFERLLPYALALDVEQRWSEQFSDILAAASQEPGQAGYQPIWYTPLHNTDFADLSFTDSLGNSLSSTISASATPPGSSSGSGGGGFSGGGSGGGGGGGGGGGW